MNAYGKEEPGWLGEDCPPDPQGDDRDWPGRDELARIVAEAEAAQADEDAARARIEKPDAVKRDYTEEQRRRLAHQGKALMDGDGRVSYPIADEEDLRNAAILARSGHGNAERARKLIARRAKELGVPNPLDTSKSISPSNRMAERNYNRDRVSEPLTEGHQAPSPQDHGVGRGRNSEIAAHHIDLRQSSPDVRPFARVEGNGQSFIGQTPFGGLDGPTRVSVQRLDAASEAGAYTSMHPHGGNPSLRGNAVDYQSARLDPAGLNGLHSTTGSVTSHAVAAKPSDRLAIMKEYLFGDRC